MAKWQPSLIVVWPNKTTLHFQFRYLFIKWVWYVHKRGFLPIISRLVCVSERILYSNVHFTFHFLWQCYANRFVPRFFSLAFLVMMTAKVNFRIKCKVNIFPRKLKAEIILLFVLLHQFLSHRIYVLEHTKSAKVKASEKSFHKNKKTNSHLKISWIKPQMLWKSRFKNSLKWDQSRHESSETVQSVKLLRTI